MSTTSPESSQPERSGAAPSVDALQPDGRLRGPRGAGDRAGRGRLRVGPARQALPRRPGRAVHVADRSRPHRARRGGCQAGRDARLLPALDLRPPARHRAGRPGGGLRPGRPQPRLLHDRRLRGGRVGVEAGPPVLPAARRAAADEGHQPRTSPTTARPWGRSPSPASPTCARRSSRSSPGRSRCRTRTSTAPSCSPTTRWRSAAGRPTRSSVPSCGRARTRWRRCSSSRCRTPAAASHRRPATSSASARSATATACSSSPTR